MDGFCNKFNESCLLVKLLINGSDISDNQNPSKTAMIVMMAVSFKNCLSICERLLPNTFLTPISFARFADCAVARLMIFTQATSNKKKPIKPSDHNSLCVNASPLYVPKFSFK